eukprot:611326_1
MSEVKEDAKSSCAFQISSVDEILNEHKIFTMDEIERRIESDPEPRIFQWYIAFQLWKPGPFIILAWWIGVILVGILYGFKLLNLTVFSFSAPPGTDGYIADEQMNELFTSISDSRQLLIYYHCNECGGTNPPIQWTPHSNYTAHLNASYLGWTLNAMAHELVEWSQSQGHIFQSYHDFYDTFFSYGLTELNLPPKIYAGTPKNKILALLSKQIFVSKDNQSAIGILRYDDTLDQTTKNNFIDDLNAKCASISSKSGNKSVTMSMTGESALIKDMNAESRKDVEKKDTLTIPIALCVLALIIRSWRLMFIPLLTFGTSICASFSVMRPFAEHVLNVNPFCPSIMMSVTIAMSIDYSLFLLSRYREEIERNTNGLQQLQNNRERMIEISRAAVRQTTRWSGKVIALSGCILSLTYFALIFYPMEVLQSVGLGAGLAIVCTILVNLTLTPAILLIFPYFFSQFGCCGYGTKEQKEATNNLNQASLIINDNDSDTTQYNVNEDDVCERCWFFCGSKTTICPWSILISVMVYAAIAPIGWQFTTFKQQLADTLIFPRDSAYFATYTHIVDDFSAGFIAPWYILIPKQDNDTTISSLQYSRYIGQTGALIKQVFEEISGANYELTIEGIGFIGSNDYGTDIRDTVITQSVWRNNITCADFNCDEWKNRFKCYNCSQLNQTYQYLMRGKISDNGSASYYQMTTLFDPYYENAITFVGELRDALHRACSKYEYDCYLSGGSVDEVDSVHTIYANFPIVLICIVSFVFCLMGIVFKSVFVPFRLFITIAVPMTFVYGLAVMVYQDGLLSALNMDCVAPTDGLYWLIPVMTVTILIGLALDYDIFLFARIYEYRVMGGVPTHEAIVRGVYKTGSIITAAGIIMGIAFCGLLLSQITSLNQTGFIMVIAVLVDTFIIRTSLVPAVLSIAKEVNWWPGIRLQSSAAGKEELVIDAESIGAANSKQINENYSVNVRPLKTGNSQNKTLDETM